MAGIDTVRADARTRIVDQLRAAGIGPDDDTRTAVADATLAAFPVAFYLPANLTADAQTRYLMLRSPEERNPQ